jgi:hypothetical protein
VNQHLGSWVSSSIIELRPEESLELVTASELHEGILQGTALLLSVCGVRKQAPVVGLWSADTQQHYTALQCPPCK